MLPSFPSDDQSGHHDRASHSHRSFQRDGAQRDGASQWANQRPPIGQQRSATQRQERELDRLTGCAAAKQIALPLAQVARLLIDANQSNRTWLKDFSDDVVRIDSDLYDVLLAYQSIRQTAS